jgi:predicted RNA-binding Zn-ribbon protein involved in translation (DUF1610 family)
LDVILFVIVAVVALATFYARLPGVKGARGERKVRRLMAAQLNPDEYHQFHDITVESSQGPTQIDHLVVSRYGVFVIETKNFSGWIFGSQRFRQWTQVIYGAKFRFQNPLHQNYKHTKAVEFFLGLPATSIHSLVVFVGRSEFRTDLPLNVTDLRGLIPYIKSKGSPLIESRDVVWLVERLAAHKSGAALPRREPSLRAVPSKPMCPRCGTAMVIRISKKGRNVGQQFWGCPTYPKCAGTRELKRWG